MLHILKTSGGARTLTHSNLWAILLLLVLLSGSVGECGVSEPPSVPSEQPPATPESVPVAPGPPPPAQERILAPIPSQFEWMQREVRPNPDLEAVLGLQEVTPRLLMTISFAEEYSDNFFLRERDREEEYRSRLSIGTIYRLERERTFVSLANSLSGTYDVRAGEGNFAFANLALNVGHELPRLSLALSESFIRSDEVEEATPTGIRRERRTFTTNTISPQVRYHLTPTTALSGAYTNTLVWNEDDGRDAGDTTDGSRTIQGDSVSHALSAGVQHWLRRNLSGSWEYTFTLVDHEEEADTRSHAAAVDVDYILNPRTSVLFGPFATFVDRQDGVTGGGRIDEGDSLIYGVSFGIRRQLTTHLAAFASVGPTVVSREDRPTRVFANWQVGLDGAVPITRRLSLSLSTQQSIDDTAGEIDDVGLVLNQSASVILNYTAARNLFTSLFANFTRTQLLEDIATNVATEDRDFTYWSAGTRISYALTPVWSLALSYRHQQRDSDVAAETLDSTTIGGKYRENRVIFSVTAAIPIL